MKEYPYVNHEFEALKTRYDDHVTLLRSMTELDYKLFSGYLTLQLVIGAWFAKNPIYKISVKIGIFLIVICMTVIAFKLIFNNLQKRKEAIETLKNINEALGFNKEGVYLKDKSINPIVKSIEKKQDINNEKIKYKVRLWGCWYLLGILICPIGIYLVIFQP